MNVLSSQPSGESRERIGRYQVLRKIATGGMAELFLARQIGMDGFEKVVAIKRILSHLAHEQEFVQMFQDEARIVAKLHHPNIVQIYDLGKSRDTYFIAMEYIPGRNLSSIAKKAKAKGEVLPPTHIAHCISQACEGLAYAHTRNDINGRPLQIVHRDVSPQNIIVAFSGSVKLVDFGIAKAATKIAHTRAGVLKGKYAYMSPEQIRGQPTDARSDLFAVGIVLYELLCGRRPFEKDNSIQTLKAIVQDEPVHCQVLNPDIPDPLAAIIDRCLEKRPDARYQTAQAVQLALEEFVSRAPKRINNLVVSQWVSNLFAEELANDHGRVNLPGVGPIVLPDDGPTVPTPSPPNSPVRRRRSAVGDPAPRAPSAGRGALPRAGSRAPRREVELIEGRSDLIEEGIIERHASALSRPTDAGGWDRVQTLNLSSDAKEGAGDGDAPSKVATVARREAPKAPSAMPLAARVTEPIGAPETRRENTPLDAEDTDPPDSPDAPPSSEDTDPRDPSDAPDDERALRDSGGFMAPLGGDSAFKDDGDDPWDEATIGLPDHAPGDTEAPEPPRQDPSKGRAHRLSHGVARRRSRVSAVGPIDEPVPRAGGPASSSAPTAGRPAPPAVQEPDGREVRVASAQPDPEDDAGWLPYEDAEAIPADDDVWDDKTNAEPSLFDEDGVRVSAFDDEGPALDFDDADDIGERTVAQPTGRDDPTVNQAAVADRDDATVNQAAIETGVGADDTYEHQVATSTRGTPETSVYDEQVLGGPKTAFDVPDGYADDRTVSYDEEFSALRARPVGTGPERTAIGVIEAPSRASPGGDMASMSDFSTVRSMSEEPALPVPRVDGDPERIDDGRTVAGVTGDFIEPPTETADAAPMSPDQQATEAYVSSVTPRPGVEPLGAIRLRKQAPSDAPTTDYAFADEAATAGADPAVGPRPRSPSSAVAAFYDASAEPVHPSPLEPPADEDDYASYQDEYSALVGQPKPLMPASSSSVGRAPAIGSTNVPPANLTLSQMLAHPSSTPRSRLSATPRVSTVGSPAARAESMRAASIRSASMVGRQIREVVRSAESPTGPQVRLSAPNPAQHGLDHGPLGLDRGAQGLDRGAQGLDRGAQRLDRGAQRLDRANHGVDPASHRTPGSDRPDAGPPRLSTMEPNAFFETPPMAESGFHVAPAPAGRRWVGPALAGLSVLLLAVAIYMALPYVIGPAGPYLRITTTPAGARVFVDGTLQQGETPITISGLLPGGRYRIRVEHDGYKPVDRPKVELPKDGPLVLQIPMEPQSAQK